MTQPIKVPDTVHEKAQELQEIHDYATLGEAVRHMCREASNSGKRAK
jgi:hypothetical protein